MKNPKKKSESENPVEVLEAITKDPAVRRAVTRESHALFFSIYLHHYIKYPMAEFQKNILRITEDASNKLACIVAFRGSAKSTLVTLSYSLWAILGVQRKKFVLIVCQTQAQAKQHMTNLRHELEQNKLLKSDLGPFQEETGGEWAMSSLVFKNMDARISIASVDQSIRGIRHNEHRPDLIILDDIEDLNSTKTMESRNKTFEWFTREIFPLGDLGTRTILVGNLLHEDSLMMRLRRKIEDEEIKGTFQWFPLLNEDGTCSWPEKFTSPGVIGELRQGVANELAWQQEYLLNIVSDSSRVVWPEWIQYGDESLEEQEHLHTVIGVDLAISERDTADCTAMVVARAYGRMENLRIYIQPNPVNARLPFPETRKRLEELSAAFTKDRKPLLLIEEVGFQAALVQEMKLRGYRAEGVKVGASDKRSRLALISHLIQDGTVRFPKKGAELLITQILGLGIERHDDLVDAFVHAVQYIKSNDRPLQKVIWIGGERRPDFLQYKPIKWTDKW